MGAAGSTTGMQTAIYEMAIEAAGFLFSPAEFLFSPVPIAAAAVVWLLLATGIVGRVVQHIEELPLFKAPKPGSLTPTRR